MGGGAKATEEMLASATALFKAGPLTVVGRALTKHPNVIGESGDILANWEGQRTSILPPPRLCRGMMDNGTETVKMTNAFGLVVEYVLPSGVWSNSQL